MLSSDDGALPRSGGRGIGGFGRGGRRIPEQAATYVGDTSVEEYMDRCGERTHVGKLRYKNEGTLAWRTRWFLLQNGVILGFPDKDALDSAKRSGKFSSATEAYSVASVVAFATVGVTQRGVGEEEDDSSTPSSQTSDTSSQDGRARSMSGRDLVSLRAVDVEEGVGVGRGAAGGMECGFRLVMSDGRRILFAAKTQNDAKLWALSLLTAVVYEGYRTVEQVQARLAEALETSIAAARSGGGEGLALGVRTDVRGDMRPSPAASATHTPPPISPSSSTGSVSGGEGGGALGRRRTLAENVAAAHERHLSSSSTAVAHPISIHNHNTSTSMAPSTPPPVDMTRLYSDEGSGGLRLGSGGSRSDVPSPSLHPRHHHHHSHHHPHHRSIHPHRLSYTSSTSSTHTAPAASLPSASHFPEYLRERASAEFQRDARTMVRRREEGGVEEEGGAAAEERENVRGDLMEEEEEEEEEEGVVGMFVGGRGGRRRGREGGFGRSDGGRGRGFGSEEEGSGEEDDVGLGIGLEGDGGRVGGRRGRLHRQDAELEGVRMGGRGSGSGSGGSGVLGWEHKDSDEEGIRIGGGLESHPKSKTDFGTISLSKASSDEDTKRLGGRGSRLTSGGASGEGSGAGGLARTVTAPAPRGRYIPPHMRRKLRGEKMPEGVAPPKDVCDLALSQSAKFLAAGSGVDAESHGLWSVQGLARRHEDAHCVHPELSSPAISFYAVLDGHGGVHTAEFVARILAGLVTTELNAGTNTQDALTKALEQAEAQWDSECTGLEWSDPKLGSGAAVVAALVDREAKEIITASVGDCLAVLCEDWSSPVAVVASTPHSPHDADETARVELAGGWIVRDKEYRAPRVSDLDEDDWRDSNMLQRLRVAFGTKGRSGEGSDRVGGEEDEGEASDEDILASARAMRGAAHSDVCRKAKLHVPNDRVCGDLGVTRALGDLLYKMPRLQDHKPAFNYPEAHAHDFSHSLISAKPELQTHPIPPNPPHTRSFLLLACDGVWDVVPPQAAVQFVAAKLCAGESPQLAAKRLVDVSLKLGSIDNITALVVLL